MARQATGSLRDATDNAAISADDVDLGWDEVPASTLQPPPSAEGVAPKVSEIRALSSSSPRELDDLNFRRHQLSPALIVFAMAAAAGLLVASVVRSQFPRVTASSSELVATVVPRESIAPSAELRRPEPSAPAIVTTRAAPSASPRETPVETPPATAVTVTVKVIPESSVIFRAGKRLGSGAMEISVEHGAKERLTALHDGFLPSNFTLDGSRDAVTVRLQRVPTPEPSASAESDPPADSGE